jgi:endonuclease YncB( thermonuclease family)
MLVPLVAITQTAPPAQPFQRLDGCVYKSQRWNDGDSFHVLLRDQKEVIFRLYFVDTPEEERVYGDRIAKQAAYFGISSDAAIEIGHEASEFTKRALGRPFTIYTRWRRARSNNTQQRPTSAESAMGSIFWAMPFPRRDWALRPGASGTWPRT